MSCTTNRRADHQMGTKSHGGQMPGSFVRHVTRYFHGGFWTAVFAATLNGVYWRVPASEQVRNVLMATTLLVAVAAIALNARVLRKPNGLTSRLGRRVTWLLLVTGALVVVLVCADMTGLREAWGLA